MKNILITGGSGFIGRNLKESLREEYNVFAPTHRELDILDFNAVDSFLSVHKIDIVIHAAVHVPMFNGADKEFFNDMQMFMNLERLSGKVEKILYFGSGAEFDKRYDIQMVSENDLGKTIPVTEYGLAKYTMTQIARKSDNIYNLRLFGIFGKYELWQIKFLSNLCCKAVFDLPLSVRKDCYFDFLYVDDLVQIIKWAIDGKPQFHDFNVCHGKPYSLLELAQLVRKISGKELRIDLLSQERNLDYTASNQRLLDEAGQIVLTTMEDALRQLYQYYSDNRSLIDFDILKESK